MIILFEILRTLFVFATIGLWIFLAKGRELLSGWTYDMIIQFVLPGYLVLCGLIVWYAIAGVWVAKYDDNSTYVSQVYRRALIMWLIVWSILALIYIFIQNPWQ